MHVDSPYMIEQYETAEAEQVMVPMEMWKTFLKAYSYSLNQDEDLREAFNMMVSSASVYEDGTLVPFNSFRLISMFDDVIGFFEELSGKDLDSINVNLAQIAPALDMMYNVVATLDEFEDANYYDIIDVDGDSTREYMTPAEHDAVSKAFFDSVTYDD
jgi:hypothetical protein